MSFLDLWPIYSAVGFIKIKCFVTFITFAKRNKSNSSPLKAKRSGASSNHASGEDARVGLLFCCRGGHHLNIFNLSTSSAVCFHLNQRHRPNVNMPVECVSANNSDETHLESPSVAFWSPELRLPALKLGRFVMATGAGNQRDGDAPWKSDCQRALLDLLSGPQSTKLGFWPW